jgi:diguanylate cyclase (GGDEF)-like protein
VAGRLCLLCCENLRPEVAAAVAAEGWDDVGVAAFPARCGQPPLTWDELRTLLAADCTQTVILGRACLHGLDAPPAGWPPVRLHSFEQCFELVAGSTMVADAIARAAYLITPGWLEHWRDHLAEMGFAADGAAEFFHDFARELVLLDTGVRADAAAWLTEMARAVDLPASRLAVGLDYTRQFLGRLVAEWRWTEQRQVDASERADLLAAMDFLARLARLTDEGAAIAAIEELFRMLFAPQRLYYLRYRNGAAESGATLPAELRAQAEALRSDWAWTATGSGFIVRIAHGGETLGAVAADGFAFPSYRERYLNLALSVAGVCGLTIENARAYQHMQETEAALRRSERSLTLAQSIAHIGHWEWDVSSEEFSWSDETYRILGYAPQAVKPSREAFLYAVHPDDRASLEEQLRGAGKCGRFDLEYRLVLPGGAVRVIRGLGEVIQYGADRQPRLIGTLQDLSPREPMELLGVIQDITERKELERQLEQEAHSDPLTGCANRRHFMQQAVLEYARARRYDGVLSVLMLDLDHFKAVNDTHGHPVGDLTLQQLVHVCRETLREEDVVGRLGGEEFAVLLPETGDTRAGEVAERLRLAIERAAVPLPQGAALHVTVSIGVAILEPDDVGIDMVLGRADRALYQAKNTGRNRIVVAVKADG